MTPRPSLRAASAALTVAALALTGCSASGGAASTSSSSSAVSAAAPASSPASPSPAQTVDGDHAKVLRVVDGDTVEVRLAGRSDTTRVRLLNVDTPETKHPSKAVQCLGPEATRHLESVLHAGDEVVLQYDVERTDRYGRTLAGVFEGGTLVNAEIARRGLGVPVVFEPNRRFYPEVLKAWEEAKAEGAGLHQPNLDCSLPAMAGPVEQGGPAEELAAAYAAAVSGDQEWMKVLWGAHLPRVKALLDARVPAGPSGGTAADSGSSTGGTAAGAPPAGGADSGAEGRGSEGSSAGDSSSSSSGSSSRGSSQGGSSSSGSSSNGSSDSGAAGSGTSSEGGQGRSSSSGDGTSSGSGSAGTSNKAPNRCYAPGGQTYTYCGEGGSGAGGGTSSGSAGGSGSGGGSASSGSGAGGPVAGSNGVCPAGYPVKVSGSNKYHLPGGKYYDKTGANNCYASAAAAEAAGAVAAKG